MHRNILPSSLALNADLSPIAINGPVQRGKPPRRPTNLRLKQRLLSVLPGTEATNLLVDTYFDRAHWFMLVFHQQEFRQQLQQLQNEPHLFQDGNTSAVGFLAVLLTVVCIGLQYLGDCRETLLATYGFQKEALQNEVIAALEESFLAIVSLGSLEAVQSCVLLGTFYLYHSDSATAWSICGCALRIAQSIKLHRSWPVSKEMKASHADDILRQMSARKRCWWALYEVEAFCCMLYGYTCSIRDEDCDMDFLTQGQESPTEDDSDVGLIPTFTLLSYKEHMSKLSIILKSALSELYGHCASSGSRARQDAGLEDAQQRLFSSVGDLNRRLHQWHMELPSEFKSPTPKYSGYEDVDQSERDIGGSGPQFDGNIVQLQALALELAYENARILVNRPLFAYKLNRLPRKTVANHQNLESSRAFLESFQICRQAALRTAEIGESPTFKFAFRSFAAAFMSTHLFTAGVTLCLSAIIEPLTEQSTEAKLGLQKLFSLQNDPVSEPLASSHVTKILERLLRVILEKELAEILGPQHQTAQQASAIRQPSLVMPSDDPGNDSTEDHHATCTTTSFLRPHPSNTNVTPTSNPSQAYGNNTPETDPRDRHAAPNDIRQDFTNGNVIQPHYELQKTLTHI